MRRISASMSDLDKSNLARAVFTSIGNSLEKMITYHLQNKPVRTLIAVGGVMSNSYFVIVWSIIVDVITLHYM